MSSSQTIFADFHNSDTHGRVRLNTTGTIADLSRLGILLKEGISIQLSDDELSVEGRVTYSTDEKLWVAEIDWNAIHKIDIDVLQPSAA